MKKLIPFILILVNNLCVAQTKVETLSEFKLNDINGHEVSSKNLIGKRLHINFWSTSCKPCIQEFPELNHLKESFDNDDYVFIAIAPESANKIAQLLARKPLNYIVIPEAYEFLELLGITSFPTNYFVNSSGEINRVIEGARFKIEMVEGKEVMIPDNFETYKKAMMKLE